MRLNRKLAELEKKLYGQLEATEADLAEWESSPYEMDSQTVAKFWSLVESAPAVGVVGGGWWRENTPMQKRESGCRDATDGVDVSLEPPL